MTAVLSDEESALFQIRLVLSICCNFLQIMMYTTGTSTYYYVGSIQLVRIDYISTVF